MNPPVQQLDPNIHTRMVSMIQHVEQHSPLIDVNAAGLAIAIFELHTTQRFDQFFTGCPKMLDARNAFFKEHEGRPRKDANALMRFFAGMNGEEGYHSMVAKYLIKILHGDIA